MRRVGFGRKLGEAGFFERFQMSDRPGWAAKLRKILSGCILAFMFVMLLGGAVRFPDWPIEECPTGYCGKWARHSYEDFRLYVIWNKAMFIGWPVGLLLMGLLNWKTDHKKK